MKVVINRCWGGFGLSHKAVMLYAKLNGIKLYAAVNKRKGNGTFDGKLVPYNGKRKPFCIHYLTKPLNKDGTYDNESYFSVGRIARNDPALVSVVEQLGGMANTRFSWLVVREIPNDVKWEISDYDGMETIHEVHRSW
jgi:hypothetical protein